MVLTVHPEPTCTVDPPDAEICSTQTQRFCAVPDGGTPGYTFSWTGPNSFSSNAECITVSDAGTYTVTVTDANGCTHDCDGVLTVVPCNQACSPGFWRNHDDDWCDENDPFLQPTDGHCPPPAPSAATTFLGAFGLGSCPNAPITISSSLTLLEAVSVAGGDNQTLFHCSAALLSSQVVAFPVLASDVQAVVQEACTGTDFFPGEVVDWGRAFSICAGWNAVESEPNGCCPFSPPDNPECPLPGALGLRGPDVRMLEVKSPTGR